MAEVSWRPGLAACFTIEADIAAPISLGFDAFGERRIVPIVGGRVHGERLQGRVLPGGADWQVIRPDGVFEIEARYAIEARDGALIMVVNAGYRHGPADVIARIAAGETVSPAEYYFRTVPKFSVTAAPHAWLGRTIFVGAAERRASVVIIKVFAVE